MDHPAPADPSDLIVGSWRLPTPLRRIPTSVWVFGIAAIVDVTLRLMLADGGVQQVWASPQFAISFVLVSFASAALVFLPGAVLVGRWTVSARRAAYVGAVLIAISELINLAMAVVPIGRLLPTNVAEPDQFGRISGLEPVSVLAALLLLAGLLLLFAAVNGSRSGDSTAGARLWAVAVALVAVATTVAAVLSLVPALTGSTDDGFVQGFVVSLSDAIVAASRAAGGLVLGLIGAVAILGRSGAEGDRRGWTAMALGAGLSTAIAGFYALVSMVGSLGFVAPAEAPSGVLFMVTGMLRLVSVIALVVGVAIGPEAPSAPGSSGRPATMSPRDPGSE